MQLHAASGTNPRLPCCGARLRGALHSNESCGPVSRQLVVSLSLSSSSVPWDSGARTPPVSWPSCGSPMGKNGMLGSSGMGAIAQS